MLSSLRLVEMVPGIWPVSTWSAPIKMDNLADTDLTQQPVYGDPVTHLPEEIVAFQIMDWLDISEVCKCGCVSTRWKYVATLNIRNRKKLDFTPLPFISVSCLNSIFRSAICLRVVRLDACWKCTTEHNLCCLARNAPKLRVLTVSRCKWVTDDAIQELSKGCKELEELDLSSCYQISDKGVCHLIELKNLRELCVGCCYGVTDKSITEITEHCSKLEELDVSWCPLVTDVGLKPLLEGCQLQLLRIKCCKRVTQEMVVKLMNAGISVNNMF